MTDTERKRLTEYLGECWHEKAGVKDTQYGQLDKCSCGQVWWGFICQNRTFTTWTDLGALKEKLVEKGDFYYFISYALLQIRHEVERIRRSTRGQMISELYNPMEYQYCLYILEPTRFSLLVAEWLRNREGGRG